MEIEKFIERCPFLYHLTSKQNAKSIIEGKVLYSANTLIDMSKNKTDKEVKTHKRFKHYLLNIDDNEILLRDQRPISEKALAKCLTDGWSVADFLFHLNNRVFMWPNLDRLSRHFKRYENEEPIIFRFPSKEMLLANPHVKFARLNTGATRPNSYLGGVAPERGSKTFLAAMDYALNVNTVAEVTFEKSCIISSEYGIDKHPEGGFKNLNFKIE